MAEDDTSTLLEAGSKQALKALDDGIAANKAELAKHCKDLTRILASDAPPTQRDWMLAKASVALTVGILAREDEQVATLLKDREEQMEDWLLETLHPQKRRRAGKHPSRRKSKRSRS